MLKLKSFGVAPLGVVALFISAPALATTEPSGQAMVQVSDLNLESDAGRKAAQKRIKAAVNSVCPEINIRDLNMRAKVLECRQQANEQAQLALLNLSNVRLAAASEMASQAR